MIEPLSPTFASAVVPSGSEFVILAGAVALLYRFFPLVLNSVLRLLTVSVEIRDPDVFRALADWLAAHPYGGVCRNLSVQLLHVPREQKDEAREISRSRALLIFAPGAGSHFLVSQRRLVWLRRVLENVENPAVRPQEVLLMRTLGRNPEPLKALVTAAVANFEERWMARASLYYPDHYNGWIRSDLPIGRTFDSVVLRRGSMERITEDIRQFLDSRDWYGAMGIPHRRGYLFYGPPGCGKSSFAAALASNFKLNIYVLNVTARTMNDERLVVDLTGTKPESIILIEDVDAAFEQRAKTDDNASRVTLSGLLNAIDGLIAQEHRILIMTTNRIEMLDEALIRPGRADVQEYFGSVTAEQGSRLFGRFFPTSPEAAHLFGEYAERVGATPAQLQSILLMHRDDPKSCLNSVRQATTALILRTAG